MGKRFPEFSPVSAQWSHIMDRRYFFALTASFLANPIGILAQQPREDCSTAGGYCRITGDNLLGIVSEVSSLTECIGLAGEAAFATHYGPSGFPYVDSCLLFSTCDTLGGYFGRIHHTGQELFTDSPLSQILARTASRRTTGTPATPLTARPPLRARWGRT